MSEIVYLPDGTQAIQTQLTGSNIPQSQPIPKKGTTRRLFYQDNIVLAAGAVQTLNDVDVTGADKVSIGIFCDANTSNTVYAYWKDKGLGNFFKYQGLISAGARLYDISSKIDVLTDTLCPGIQNNDTVPHTYKLVVWGS